MAAAYNWQDTCLAQAGGADAAQIAPAADNNKGPILEVLRRHLPPAGPPAVLEVASGTGQHAAHFAAALPQLQWQPSDAGPDLFPSIAAHCRGLANVRPPLQLDASWPPDRWSSALGGAPPAGAPSAGQQGAGGAGGAATAGQQGADAAGGTPSFRAVYVANMTHIAPWAATAGLVAGAAAVLAPGGLLAVYGPFKLRGSFTTDSNRAFHERLVASNPEWGYRDSDDVTALADAAGLSLLAVQPMPANNFMLMFTKRG